MGEQIATRRRFTALFLAAFTAAAHAAGPRTLLIEPNIRLSRMRFAGGDEERPDWSAQAGPLVTRHVRNALLSRGREVVTRTRAALGEDGRQVLLLHDALRVSMRQSEWGDPPPASMKRTRDWTLGPGVRALAGESGATQALLVDAGGAFTGFARAIYVAGALAAGGQANTGLQRASASLVDLGGGDILWRNAIVAAPEADMRIDEGAHLLVTALLSGAPL